MVRQQSDLVIAALFLGFYRAAGAIQGTGTVKASAQAVSSIAIGMSTSAMSAMGDMSGAAAFADPSEAEMRQTVSEALMNGAKGASEQLSKKK
jgi:hypothetical protein